MFTIYIIIFQQICLKGKASIGKTYQRNGSNGKEELGSPQDTYSIRTQSLISFLLGNSDLSFARTSSYPLSCEEVAITYM